jgi:molybdate transport system ATP-binding protein
LLGQVGLRGLTARRLLTLSYGQRRRALLARALVRPIDVLLLDEALNGLDVNGRKAFLRALRRTLSPGAAWILTSHRRADAHVVGATHLATLAHGRLERVAPIGAFADRGSSRSKATRRSSPGQAPLPHAARWLLRLERAAIYRDGRAVIAPFDWTLVEGEHWLVRGANGSGKSTLIALAYGDLWPRHGGALQRRWPAAEDWKRRVGLVSPELQARYAATGCTVRDIVASGLHDSIGLNDFVTPAEARRVSRELSRWGLRELAGRKARELSYGQLRLVLAARAFVRRRRLYLLDEPFDGLDVAARERLRDRLDAAVREAGATVVIVSHHADDVPDYVRCELTLRRGRTPSVAVRPAARPRTRSPRRR